MKDFAVHGLWWFPESPETRYSGKLEFNDGRGGHVNWMRSAEYLPKPLEQPRELNFFYGTSTRCENITLYRCIELPRSFSGPLNGSFDSTIEHREVFASTAFIGGHVQAEHLERIISISASIEKIPSWPAEPPLSIKQPQAFSNEFSATYASKQPVKITINENVSVRVGTRIAKGLSEIPHRPLWNISLKEELWISIDFGKPTNYADATWYLRVIFDFFAISALTAPHFSEIKIAIDNPGSGRSTMTLDVHHSDLNWESEDTSEHGIQMLFNQKKAGEHLPHILANWVNQAQIVEGSRNYYMSALYGPKATLESNFLMLCTAAESIHRILYSGKLIPDQVFESEVLPALQASIPEHLGTSIKESLRGKLSFLNEYSLNRRLKDLWRDNLEAANHFAIDGKRLANLCTSLRNGLTHVSTHTKQHEPISDFTVCSNFLRFLIELSFLKLMGFPDNFRSRLATECYKYKWIFKR